METSSFDSNIVKVYILFSIARLHQIMIHKFINIRRLTTFIYLKYYNLLHINQKKWKLSRKTPLES